MEFAGADTGAATRDTGGCQGWRRLQPDLICKIMAKVSVQDKLQVICDTSPLPTSHSPLYLKKLASSHPWNDSTSRARPLRCQACRAIREISDALQEPAIGTWGCVTLRSQKDMVRLKDRMEARRFIQWIVQRCKGALLHCIPSHLKSIERLPCCGSMYQFVHEDDKVLSCAELSATEVW